MPAAGVGFVSGAKATGGNHSSVAFKPTQQGASLGAGGPSPRHSAAAASDAARPTPWFVSLLDGDVQHVARKAALREANRAAAVEALAAARSSMSRRAPTLKDQHDDDQTDEEEAASAGHGLRSLVSAVVTDSKRTAAVRWCGVYATDAC